MSTHAPVREAAVKNVRMKTAKILDVSRLVAQQAAKSRPHKNLIPVSGLKPGDIVATLRIRRDTWKGGVEEIFHIGEVGAVNASTEHFSVL
ncbi:unnamed protein product [Bathycoccus prasinos]